jgi:protein phosphatase
LDIYGFSDIGKIREKNEDEYAIEGFKNNKNQGYCIIADGMGGHNSGEIASKIAVKVISIELNNILKNKLQHIDIKKIILNSLKKANEKIYNQSLNNKEQSGMGTTIIVCFIKMEMIYIANIGDSRVYVFNENNIKKITTDHSMIEELILSGNITEKEAKNHPQKHLITRSLGTKKNIDPDFYEYFYKQNDVIIMATDGLTEMLDLKEIKKILSEKKSAKTTTLNLVKKANERGGLDNITVITIKI